MNRWRFAPFAELTPREVHDLFQLRSAVFVVEQACVFQDIDGVDPECWHLLGYELGPGLHRGGQPQDRLVSYCRFVPPGTKFAEPSIGRVITTRGVRRTGRGRELMAEALRRAEKLWPSRAIRIGAQRHLERFYTDFGFVTVSAPYDEDGILHVEMLRRPSAIPDNAARIAGQQER